MKTLRRTQKYAACENCGGAVVERKLTIHRRFEGKLHEFEDVPVGACTVCGNRIFKGQVLERLATLAKDKKRVKRTIRVPVTAYRTA